MLALIAAANATIQDPSSVGTMLKTMSLRLQGSKTELEKEGLDVEGMASSVSKLRAEILALSGVDIQKTNNSFKDMYDIVEEIAAVWDDLDNMAQASILTLIGGARGGNVLGGLISNFSDAAAAVEVSNNALGTAARLQAEYLDSIQGKTAKMSAAFQELSTNLVDSSFVKGFYDMANTLLSALNAWDSALPKILAIPAAFAVLPAIFKTISGLTIFNNIKTLSTNLLNFKVPKFKVSRNVGTPIIGNANGCLRFLEYQPASNPVSKKANMLGSTDD